MPPCSCGVEVEDIDNSIACVICGINFHYKCCNINFEDAEFVKSSAYKCCDCLRERRRSPPLLPLLSSASMQRSVDQIKAKAAVVAPADMVTGVLANIKSPSINAMGLNADMSDNASIGGNIAEIVVGTKSTGSSAAAVVPASENNATSYALDVVSGIFVSSSDNALLAMFLNEVRSLKSSNEELKALVSSLSEQNLKLVAKFDNLEASLRLNNVSSNNTLNASPKRKKMRSFRTISSEASTSNDMTSQLSVNCLSINPASDSDASSAATTAPSFATILRSSSGNHRPPADSNTAAAVLSNSVNAQPDWTHVGKVRKSKNNLIGTGANLDIGVISNFKWLHLSSFKNSVTETDIINYLSKTSNISTKNFACYKLVKKTDDISKLNFINFKLGIVSDYYNVILSPALWPANVRVRPFIFSGKKTVPTAEAFLEQQMEQAMEQPPAPSELSPQATD